MLILLFDLVPALDFPSSFAAQVPDEGGADEGGPGTTSGPGDDAEEGPGSGPQESDGIPQESQGLGRYVIFLLPRIVVNTNTFCHEPFRYSDQLDILRWLCFPIHRNANTNKLSK